MMLKSLDNSDYLSAEYLLALRSPPLALCVGGDAGDFEGEGGGWSGHGGGRCPAGLFHIVFVVGNGFWEAE